MNTKASSKLTEHDVRSTANGFLLDNLPDAYLAVEPRLDATAQAWHVKVILSYPFIGSVGEVGEIVASAFSEEVLSHTPLSEMRERARQCYEENREAIQAAFAQGMKRLDPIASE